MRKFDEAKLNEVYKCICDYHNNERRSPTYREIGQACNIGSISWVSNLVQVLEDRDLISLETRGKRRVISVPSDLCAANTRNASIVGSCPCGEPILAVENIISTVALPIEIFGDAEHFILTAKGNSMIRRGIFNGDLMVVRSQSMAKVGEVVIARVNNEEATAKVLAYANGRYYLKPANDEVDEDGNRLYNDIYPDGEWDIVGVVDHIIHAPKREEF